MACDISNGRIEQCKDSVSGLKAVYIINYDKLNSDSVTYLTTPVGSEDVIDTWTPVDTATALNLYKYELKSTANSFNTTINTSRDNGTTFFEQTLVMNLKRQDAATTKNVKLLAYGRPRIVVRTMTDQFFFSFNGYEGLTFVAQEELNANFIDCTTEAQLAAVFNNGTDDAVIVTS
jgi:hypothetical protein